MQSVSNQPCPFVVKNHTHHACRAPVCICNVQRWCQTCTRCDELNFSEYPIGDFNCGDDNSTATLCQPGDQLWVRSCDDGYGALFQAKYASTGSNTSHAVMLQVAGTLVCVTRTKQRYVTLQLCDSMDHTQMWKAAVSATNHFRLEPAFWHPNDDGVEFCVAQHHHPKEYELMGLKYVHLCRCHLFDMVKMQLLDSLTYPCIFLSWYCPKECALMRRLIIQPTGRYIWSSGLFSCIDSEKQRKFVQSKSHGKSCSFYYY